MSPPDDLTTLKHIPSTMLGAGLFVVPSMWAFVLGVHAMLALAPITGLIFLAFGLYTKYRSRYSPREALWAFPVALIFFGSLLVASTTSLVWRAGRPDLQWLAIVIAVLLTVGGMAVGCLSEMRRLRVQQKGVPESLLHMLDLRRHRVLPTRTAQQSKLGRIAFLAALALNVPLLLHVGNRHANDVVLLAMPLLGATVTYVLASGLGPALARVFAILKLERRLGQPFCTSRLEELEELRRTF